MVQNADCVRARAHVALLSVEGGRKRDREGRRGGANVSESVVSHFSHLSIYLFIFFIPGFCFHIGARSRDVSVKCAEREEASCSSLG